jgi:hypothetical protein
MPGGYVPLVMEALKFFEGIKGGVEGITMTGSALLASAKMSAYLIQKGARSLSILITSAKKKRKGKGNPKEETPSLSKNDVAIVVDINNRIVANVEAYLRQKNIDADLIIITNDTSYSDEIKSLNVKKPKEWQDLARDFKAHSQKIKRLVSGAKVHIFMAVPLPLAFGMGAVWGTVDEATVYHWENKTYHPVMKIERSLRFKE